MIEIWKMYVHKNEMVWNDERAKEMRFRECIMPKISRVAFSILWIKAAMLMSTKLTRVAKAADALLYRRVAVVQQKWCCKCCSAILSLFSCCWRWVWYSQLKSINQILNTNIFWTQVTHSVSHHYFVRVILIFKNFWNSLCACSQIVPTASLVSEHILFSL